MSSYKRVVVVLGVLVAGSVSWSEAAAAATSTPTPVAQETTPGNTSATPSGQADKIKLGVYMESLCPDSRRFFLNQLVPTQLLIGQAIDLRLVPFGHARTLGNNRMVCQHGARECEGNRRMACLLARSQNQTELVVTFGCIFRLEEDAKTCVGKHMAQVNFDELEKCTAGDESYQLMVRAEKDTGKVGYVPHLTVNGQSSEDIQDGAEHRLREYLCSKYTGQGPLEGCKNPPAEEGAAPVQW